MGSSTSRPKIEGHCDPKYEKVKEHLEKMLVNGADENVQLCVYVKGECVIDLCGASDDKYNADKTQVCKKCLYLDYHLFLLNNKYGSCP